LKRAPNHGRFFDASFFELSRPSSRASAIMTASQTTSASYEVGYRKPPRHTQFQKGQSGNPGGRPRRPAKRLEELALDEAYRTTIVREDGDPARPGGGHARAPATPAERDEKLKIPC
jgi:hypothetical protein